MIKVSNLHKTYKTPKLHSGFKGNIKNLFARKYRTIKAVDGLSFEIDQGEVVGLIGANGAGKSTTIKLLTGIISPDEGEINVNGFVPQQHQSELLKNIGVVFGQRSQLWWDIGVEDSYNMIKVIYDIDQKTYKKRLDWLVEVMEIQKLLSQPVRTLSLGQRMRCDLVAALLHNPQIIFLDEPTIGLDVNAKLKIREFLKDINKEFNTTILLTSHDMFEIEKVCNYIMIINEGQMFFKGTQDQLKEKMNTQRTIKFKFREPIIERTLQVVRGFNLVHNILDDTTLEVKVSSATDTVNILLKKVLDSSEVKDVTIEEPSIEDIIRTITAKEVS